MTFRLAEPWEQRPLLCSSRRTRRGKVVCDRMALHPGPHCGRSSRGAWFFW